MKLLFTLYWHKIGSVYTVIPTCTVPWGVRSVPVLALTAFLHVASTVKEKFGYLFINSRVLEDGGMYVKYTNSCTNAKERRDQKP